MPHKVLDLALVVLIGLGYLACSQHDLPNVQPSSISSMSRVEKGKYLVDIIGCNDCHSPKTFGSQGPEEIQELRLSGFRQDSDHPKVDLVSIENGWALISEDGTSAAGPWGVSFAANLTPDPSGIGNWTEDHFIKAIKHGKLKGLDNGRELLPPMPWVFYRNMTEEDLGAIFAYLQTIEPVQNIVPPPINLEDVQE